MAAPCNETTLSTFILNYTLNIALKLQTWKLFQCWLVWAVLPVPLKQKVPSIMREILGGKNRLTGKMSKKRKWNMIPSTEIWRSNKDRKESLKQFQVTVFSKSHSLVIIGFCQIENKVFLAKVRLLSLFSNPFSMYWTLYILNSWYLELLISQTFSSLPWEFEILIANCNSYKFYIKLIIIFYRLKVVSTSYKNLCNQNFRNCI